jgi:dTMP kinase
LCDRFTDSSEAYQGGGRELGSSLVLELHRSLCHDLQPDLTILMVSDVARTVARARRRNQEQFKGNEEDENRFEKENRSFYGRVAAGYMAIAKRAPQRVAQVDAKDNIEKVHEKIVRLVEERLFTIAEKAGRSKV